jgi:hypothetical protein
MASSQISMQIYQILVSNDCYQAELGTQVLHAIMAMLDTTTSQSAQVMSISQLSPAQQATVRVVTTGITLETWAQPAGIR